MRLDFYLDDLESSIENPWHLKDNDIVERVRVVVLHHIDHELCELHVHVLKASIPAVEYDGKLGKALLPAQSFQLVDKELLHVLSFLNSLDMFAHTEYQQLHSVLVSIPFLKIYAESKSGVSIKS